jgi:hypothetical protein
VVNLHHPSFQLLAGSRFLPRCDRHATAVAARTRYYPKQGKWGITVMMACLAQKERPLGLMPSDWLMLFAGTMIGGVIVLLF